MTECLRCPAHVGDLDAPMHQAVHDIDRFAYRPNRPPTTAPAAAPQPSPSDGVAAGAGGSP